MMQVQETRRMSDENKGGGSDLDIFEGLGRKNSEKVPVAPPAPPGSSSSSLQTARVSPIDAKRTLLGIPGPAPAPPSTRPSTAGLAGEVAAAHPQSGAMRATNGHTKSDAPPPGRGSLPNLPTSKSNPPIEAAAPVSPPQRTSATHRVASEQPPPYNPAARHNSSHPPPAIVKTRNGKLDAQPDAYEEDDAAETNVFHRSAVATDKKVEAPAAYAPTQQFAEIPMPSTQNNGGSGHHVVAQQPVSSNPSSHPSATPGSNKNAAPLPSDGLDTLVASPAQQAASERASKEDESESIPQAPDTASLSAAFGALGEPEAASISKRSLPASSGPQSGSMRSVPPPPPPSIQKGMGMTQPVMQAVPPPPPPGAKPSNAPGMQTMPSAQHIPIPPPPVTQPYTVQSSPPPSVHPSAPPPPVQSTAPGPMQSLPPVARLDATYTFPKKEKSGNGFVLAVLLTVVAIAGAAVWMFTPRTGTLVINVADAKGGPVQKLEVTVDGTKKCDSAPCTFKEMNAGTHQVSVSAPGFDPVAARAVTVEARKDVTSDFNLSAAKTVASAGTGMKIAGPAGVKLQLDGKDVGTLPYEAKDLTAGDHKLHFTSDLYAPMDKTITVGKDEMVDVGTVPLKVTKGKATIQLGTPGAKVTLVMGTTRKEVSTFPMAIVFDPNEKWELQATKDGMDPYNEKIAFEDGNAEKTYNVTLQPKSVAAKTTPAGDAPKVAKTSSTPKESSDGDDSPKPKKVSSAEATGETALKINSLPASSIVLDGKPIGVTPQAHVTVTPGSHTVMFVNSEESLKKTITVEVKAGETKAAFAKLRE